MRSQLDRAERGSSSTNDGAIVNRIDNQARDRDPHSRSIKSSEVKKRGDIPPNTRNARVLLRKCRKFWKFTSPITSTSADLLLQRLACLRRPRGAAEHPSGSKLLEPPGRRPVLRRGWRGNPEQARAGGVMGPWSSVTVSLADLSAGIALLPCLPAFTGAGQEGGKGSQLTPAAPADPDQGRKPNSRR